jgi:NitT/TauT family transport system permease protein
MKVLKRVLRGGLIALFWLGIWEAGALAVGKPLLFPGPLSVLQTLAELWKTPAFYKVTGNSLWNILLGFLLATVLGVLLSVLTSHVRIARDLLQPLMAVVKATPVASFIILAILWMGSARVPSFITALIVLPIIWTNLDAGYKTVDPALLEMTRVYRFSPWRRFRCLILPSVRPYFISSVRMSIGLAWKAGIAAEIITMPKNSIGTMIGEAKQYIETSVMFAWTLTVIVLSLLIELAVSLLLRRTGNALTERKEPI